MIHAHTLFGVVALAAGLGVLLGAKGTRQHRRVGAVYVLAMLGLCAGSFGIGSGPLLGFGVFHVLALASLATVGFGIVPALMRPRPRGWLDAHFHSMAWSYAGLVMALGSHLAGPLSAQLRALGAGGPVAGLLAMALLWGAPPALCRWMLARREARYRAAFAGGPV